MPEKSHSLCHKDLNIILLFSRIIICLKNKLQLHEAAQSIYHFAWHTFADVYIEASKTQLQDDAQKENTQKILLYCLAQILKTLHPFMPYITEVIWDKIPKDENKLLMIEKWPN